VSELLQLFVKVFPVNATWGN